LSTVRWFYRVFQSALDLIRWLAASPDGLLPDGTVPGSTVPGGTVPEHRPHRARPALSRLGA
jgi:hypothetical protein